MATRHVAVSPVRSKAGGSSDSVINIALDSERNAFLSAFKSKDGTGQDSDLTRLLAQGDATRSRPLEAAYTFWIIVLDQMLATAKSAPLRERIRTILSDGHFSRPSGGRSVSIRPEAAPKFSFLLVYGHEDTMRKLGPAFPYLLRYFIDPQPGGEGTIVRHNKEIGTEGVRNPSLGLLSDHYIKSRITLFYAEIAFVFQRISELRTDRLVLEHGTAYIQALIDVLGELINGRRADVALYTTKELDSEPVKAAKKKAKEAELGLYSTLRPRRPTDDSTLQGAYDRLFNRTDGIITRFLAPDSGEAAVGTGEPSKAPTDVASLADSLLRRSVVGTSPPRKVHLPHANASIEGGEPPSVPKRAGGVVLPSVPPPKDKERPRTVSVSVRRSKLLRRDLVSQGAPRPHVPPSADASAVEVPSGSSKIVSMAPPSRKAPQPPLLDSGGATEDLTEEFSSGQPEDVSDAELSAMPGTELPDTDSMLQKIADLEEALQSAQDELESLRERDSSLEKEIDSKEQELQDISEQLSQKEEELQRREKENESLQEQLSEAEARQDSDGLLLVGREDSEVQGSGAPGTTRPPRVEDEDTAALKEEIVSLKSKLELAQSDREALERELEVLKQRQSELDAATKGYRQSLAPQTRDFDSKDSVIESLRAELEDAKRTITSLQEALQQSGKNHARELDELSKRLSEVGISLSEARAENSRLRLPLADMDGLRSKLERTEKEIEELRRQAGEAVDPGEVEGLREQITQLQEELAGRGKISPQALSELQAELRRLRKFENAQKDVQRLQELLKKKDEELALLQEKAGHADELEADLESLKKEVEEARLKDSGDMRDKIVIPTAQLEELRGQVCAAKTLDRRLQSLQKEKDRDGLKLRDALEELERLKSAFAVEQDKFEALQAEKEKLAEDLQTLRQAQERRKSRGVAVDDGLRRKREDAEIDLARMRNEVAQLQGFREQSLEDAHKAKERAKAAKKELEEANADFIALAVRRDRLEEEIRAFEKRKGTQALADQHKGREAKQEIARLKRALEETNTRARAESEHLRKALDKATAKETERSRLTTTMSRVYNKLSEIYKTVSQFKVREVPEFTRAQQEASRQERALLCNIMLSWLASAQQTEPETFKYIQRHFRDVYDEALTFAREHGHDVTDDGDASEAAASDDDEAPDGAS